MQQRRMEVNILLLHGLSRLGQDTDKVIKYWHLFRDLGVSIHTADEDEVDFSSIAMLLEFDKEIRKCPGQVISTP